MRRPDRAAARLRQCRESSERLRRGRHRPHPVRAGASRWADGGGDPEMSGPADPRGCPGGRRRPGADRSGDAGGEYRHAPPAAGAGRGTAGEAALYALHAWDRGTDRGGLAPRRTGNPGAGAAKHRRLRGRRHGGVHGFRRL